MANRLGLINKHNIERLYIEKLRLSTFEHNGKLRWNLKNFIHLTSELYKNYWQKKITPNLWAYRAFGSTSHHSALYIFWTMIVVLDLPF
jgi:hypothetical protein